MVSSNVQPAPAVIATPERLEIDEAAIQSALATATADPVRVREVLARARELHGLDPADVAVLAAVKDEALLAELFATARGVKERIYGRRLVLFAPLYVSNLCGNECTYCAFRVRNRAIARRALTMEEVAREVDVLLRQGHKRVLLVAGEAYPREGFRYILRAVEAIYAVRTERAYIRRVNVNVAPLTLDECRELRDSGIGTYQLFQETYHRPTYQAVHLAGKKRDYDWRATALHRAMAAGIDDVGIGVLFGLHDWRYEVLALMQHIRSLEAAFGVGPHTISVPRLEPATGSDVAASPPCPVDDTDFRKIVAILRLAVPYTGIIMSTRETARIRRETFALGVSQISAGSRTQPAGYAESDADALSGQFCLGDHRSLDEVVRDVAELGYLPSFCTACYRLGRTGRDFMDLAKPGEIRRHCDPNGLTTFQEYLADYASPGTRLVGERLIDETLREVTPEVREVTARMLERVVAGHRDVLC
jgi:2-iminoacetate synthase